MSVPKKATRRGSELAVSADQITLLDVYRVVADGETFTLHHNPPSPNCVVGRSIGGVLKGVVDKAQLAMEQALAQVTIEQILADVLSQSER